MDLLLALLLSAASQPPPHSVAVRAEARIRILQPHVASSKSWDPASRPSQREIIRKEKVGSIVRLRLTEFE